jgi:hypothetical protein
VFIFFDKSDNIRFHPDILERLWSEPLIADKSLFATRTRFELAVILNEKK